MTKLEPRQPHHGGECARTDSSQESACAPIVSRYPPNAEIFLLRDNQRHLSSGPGQGNEQGASHVVRVAVMSSGFVSGGTADAPIERSDEWLAAQEELEATRRRKAEELRQSNGRSLYETLKANEAAKQEAFEEANKLKNQFRALDEDEIEFLDSVLESTRREEERVKRETAEGLLTFRQRQDEADKKLLQGRQGDAVSPVEEAEVEWTLGAGVRKRKRKTEREGLRGVKLRRSSTATSGGLVENKGGEGFGPAVAVEALSLQMKEGNSAAQDKKFNGTVGIGSKPVLDSITSLSVMTKGSTPTPIKGGLGLVDYGTDSEDD